MKPPTKTSLKKKAASLIIKVGDRNYPSSVKEQGFALMVDKFGFDAVNAMNKSKFRALLRRYSKQAWNENSRQYEDLYK